MSHKQIYAIRDNTARMIIGGLHLFAHEAAAVRFFGDVAGDPQTMVARHINDHELICCGVLNEETGVIEDDTAKLVITGAAWKAAQAPVEGEETK